MWKIGAMVGEGSCEGRDDKLGGSAREQVMKDEGGLILLKIRCIPTFDESGVAIVCIPVGDFPIPRGLNRRVPVSGSEGLRGKGRLRSAG